MACTPKVDVNKVTKQINTIVKTKKGTRTSHIFPITPADWYTLDMHPNKMGHREIATQILEQLARTDYGRDCLSG